MASSQVDKNDKNDKTGAPDDVAEIKHKLAKRMVFAGTMIVALLGGLALFDHYSAQPETEVAAPPQFTEPVPVAKKMVTQPVTPAELVTPPAVAPAEPEVTSAPVDKNPPRVDARRILINGRAGHFRLSGRHCRRRDQLGWRHGLRDHLLGNRDRFGELRRRGNFGFGLGTVVVEQGQTTEQSNDHRAGKHHALGELVLDFGHIVRRAGLVILVVLVNLAACHVLPLPISIEQRRGTRQRSQLSRLRTSATTSSASAREIP